MGRKYNIGILCNELTRNFQNPLYKATKYWGEKMGVNLFFFEGRQLFGRKYSDIQHNVTFSLANEAFIDGYIFHPIFTHISHEQIVRWCKGFSSKPKVSINKRIADLTCCVKVDNYRGMKTLLEHLSKDHSYKNIAFVYGAENNDESRDRFRAYKDFMTSKNSWSENFVFNGGFESDSGINAIKTIIASGIEFDAVVFSNDESAIAALDYINNSASEYKNKFAITGFDDSPHGQFSIPPLTSVSQPFDDLARTSLELLINLIEDNQRIAPERLLPTRLALRESCGCKNRDIVDTSSLKLYTSPYSINENIESFNREEFYDKLTQALDPSSINSCYVVLYEEPFSFENSQSSDASFLAYAYKNNERIETHEPIKFNTSQLLPDDLLASDNTINAVIQPLFYRDDHFGYVVFDGTHAKEIDMDDFRSTISSNLHTVILFEDLNLALKEKNLALKKVKQLNIKLSTVNDQLEKVSKIDELTQSYNRRGFYQAIENKLNDKRLTMPITLFYIDLDHLKQINDQQGHASGDKAIALASEVLTESFRNDDIIGRVGGDEFVIFTTGCTDSDITCIIERTEKLSQKINQSNALSFTFSMSMGYKTIEEKSMVQIEKAIAMADKELYKAKQNKKNQ